MNDVRSIITDPRIHTFREVVPEVHGFASESLNPDAYQLIEEELDASAERLEDLICTEGSY